MSDNLLSQAVSFIQQKTSLRPDIAIILGSGLGPLADEINAKAIIPYSEIPGFATSTAPGLEKISWR
jgi:purine-nucleoside phosphorylase